MSEQELLSHKRITPEIAAMYLQDGTTAQEIRIKARNGTCLYCSAEQPSGKRWAYRVNPGLLIQYKAGRNCSGTTENSACTSSGKKANMELLSTNTFTQENNDIVWEIVIKSWKKSEHTQ